MNVLVTGANGLIGRTIVKKLLENNFQVQQLINKNFECHKKQKNGIFYKADITDLQNLFASVGTVKIDVVIHTAGLAHQFGKQDRQSFWKTNVLGTENVAKLAVALKVKHLILISSVSVYGTRRAKSGDAKKEQITEEAICFPEGFYAESKLESEKTAVGICEAGGIALTILRLATVIGEEDRGNVARLIKSIDKRKFVWIGNGENLKSLIYKGDVGDACIRVIGKTNGTDIYNVTGEALKMNRVVNEISVRLGKRIPRLTISPEFFQKIFLLNSRTVRIKKIENFSKTLEKWLSDDVFSGEKIQTDYGFHPETSVSEAIRRQVESYRQKK